MTGTTGDSEFRRTLVLVTGGARGLGRAVSLAFAARGAHVVVNYFHAREEAPRLLDEIHASGGSAELLRASVADKAQVDLMFDAVASRHGGLDVLVNNAASGALLPLSELDESHWQRAMDTNFRGSLWCARRAAPLIAARGGGAIVNVSSLGSTLVISDYATVGTSKAAVEALTRYLAVEYAPSHIRVNTASGGLLDSAVAKRFPEADRLAQRVRDATPLDHRLGREDELAELVIFLASSAASWITGQTVVADGGLSLGAMLMSPESAGLSLSRPSATAPREPQRPRITPLAVRVESGAVGPSHTAKVEVSSAPDLGAEIAVVGMGVVTPGANNPEQLWRLLDGQHHVFGEPELFDIESFYSADPDAEDRSYARRSGFITDFQPHPRLRAELDQGMVPTIEKLASLSM